MPCDFIKEQFLKDFMECAKDKVSNVRREFASAIVDFKPHLESHVDLALELMEILTQMQNDSDKDV